LGRDPARPEDWQLSRENLNRITEVGPAEVLDAYCARIANMHRCAMHRRIFRRHLHGFGNLARSDRTHAHTSPEHAGWLQAVLVIYMAFFPRQWRSLFLVDERLKREAASQ
jgi:hypothetical protein